MRWNHTLLAVAALTLAAGCEGSGQQAANNKASAALRQRAALLTSQGGKDLAAGRAKEALRSLRQAVLLGQGGHQVHAQMARALLALKQPEAARAACHMALRLKPKEPELMILLGQAELEAGFPEQAVNTLKQARTERPKDPTLKAMLRRARQRTAQRGKAAKLLKSGVALAERGKHAAAEEVLRQARAFHPEHAEITWRLAEALCLQRKHPAVIELLRKVVDTRHQDARAALLFGVALAYQGKQREAQGHLGRAVSLRLPDTQFQLWAANTALRAGQAVDARWLLDKALEFQVRPDKDKVLLLCLQVQTQRGVVKELELAQAQIAKLGGKCEDAAGAANKEQKTKNKK